MAVNNGGYRRKNVIPSNVREDQSTYINCTRECSSLAKVL